MNHILLRFGGCSEDDNEGLHRCSGLHRMCATHWHDRLYGTYQENFAWRLQSVGVDELQMVQRRRVERLSFKPGEKLPYIFNYTVCAAISNMSRLLKARDSPTLNLSR
jgi:hypothetical protein